MGGRGEVRGWEWRNGEGEEREEMRRQSGGGGRKSRAGATDGNEACVGVTSSQPSCCDPEQTQSKALEDKGRNHTRGGGVS